MAEEKCNHSRRTFLKSSAAGTAGLMLSGMASKSFGASVQGSSWVDGMQINPDISNDRVVFCQDDEMLTGTVPENWDDLEPQNDLVNTEQVHLNMDKLAVALAEKPTAEEAWASIFHKPESKQWNEVKAAIKINSLQTNKVRLAIIEKVSLALIDLGVSAGNIYLFDGGNLNPEYSAFNHRRGNRMVEYGGDYGLGKMPAGIQVEGILGGDYTDVTINGETMRCCSGLADESVDIMVNISTNKQHSMETTGRFTLSMKNHIGSVYFGHYESNQENIDLLVGINQHHAILGSSTPVRQQLCIIDSLWVNDNTEHYSNADTAPCYLVMGTFSPVVDYQTVKKLREEAMGWTRYTEEVLNGLMTGFGYDPDTAELEWVDAVSYEPPAGSRGGEIIGKGMIINVPGRSSEVQFKVPANAGNFRLGIFDGRGRLVRGFELSHGNSHNLSLTWDGINQAGEKVPAGTYLMRLDAGRVRQAQRLVLVR